MKKATVTGEEIKRNPAREKKTNNGHGFMYLPKGWEDENVIVLCDVQNVEIDGKTVSAECREYKKPSVYKKGTGCAVFINKNYVGSECVAVLNPKSVTLQEM